MATQMITLKLEHVFLKEIDSIVDMQGYQNRTEFIRNALREKIEKVKLDDTLKQIARLRGASKLKTTDEQLEEAREKAFNELYGKLR
jgi:metal-responsive CopG/Arc/MetJ family transcriptional regulator